MILNQALVDEALNYGRRFVRYGKTADYIEELANKDASKLGIAISDMQGNYFCAGDCETLFTMQSISKLITLILAILQNGEEYVFTKVGKEPTGDSFNSMVRLDHLTNNKPFNPMINAGAIAVTSCIRGNNLEARKDVCLNFVRKVTDNPKIDIDYSVFASEKATGYKNRAIINLMRSNKIIDGNIEDHLDLYFANCSIDVNCIDMMKFAVLLANNGKDIQTGEEIIPLHIVKLLRSLMVTCGMYDYSGEFAAKVGMPSKSGVGGGIISAPIGKYGIAVYGPALDSKGNSIGGLKILESLSEKLDLNMF